MVKQNVHIVVVSVKDLKDQTEKYIVRIVITKNGVNIRGNKTTVHNNDTGCEICQNTNDKSTGYKQASTP